MLINNGSEWKIPKYRITRTVVSYDDRPDLYPDGVSEEITLTPEQQARLEEVKYNMGMGQSQVEAYVLKGEGEITDTRTLEEKLIDKVIELDPTAIEDEAIKSSFPVWEQGQTYGRFTYLTHEGVLYKTIHPIRNFEVGSPPERPELYTRIGAQTEDGGIAIEEWRKPTGTLDAYKIGDKVTWKGKTWICTLGNGAGLNTWEPDVYGWKEVTP